MAARVRRIGLQILQPVYIGFRICITTFEFSVREHRIIDYL